MMDWNGHMSSGGWVVSILGAMIMLAVVAAVVAWIAREVGDRRRPLAATPGREILDRRLASGEIKTDEYEHLRQTLGMPLDPGPRPSPVRTKTAASEVRGRDA